MPDWKELEQLIARDYANTAGIVIMKDGETLYEGYFRGNGPDDAMHMFSVTKSVCSALVGIAIAQGHIKNIEQRVLDFFPRYKPDAGNKTIHLVTIRHLLTMTAPFHYEAEPFEEYFQSENRMQTALGYLGGTEKPGRFRYSPFLSAHLISGILASAAGRPVLDFAAENLFAPLGIERPRPATLSGEQEYWAWYEKPRHEQSWVVDPQGISPGGWGLCLTPMSMAKIGELYRCGGVWRERQVLPASWARESVSVRSRWEEAGLGYGYLWWVPDDGQVCAAMGDGGNIICVNKKIGLTVAAACRFEPDAKDRIGLMGVIEAMLYSRSA